MSVPASPSNGTMVHEAATTSSLRPRSHDDERALKAIEPGRKPDHHNRNILLGGVVFVAALLFLVLISSGFVFGLFG